MELYRLCLINRIDRACSVIDAMVFWWHVCLRRKCLDVYFEIILFILFRLFFWYDQMCTSFEATCGCATWCSIVYRDWPWDLTQKAVRYYLQTTLHGLILWSRPHRVSPWWGCKFFIFYIFKHTNSRIGP